MVTSRFQCVHHEVSVSNTLRAAHAFLKRRVLWVTSEKPHVLRVATTVMAVVQSLWMHREAVVAGVTSLTLLGSGYRKGWAKRVKVEDATNSSVPPLPTP